MTGLAAGTELLRQFKAWQVRIPLLGFQSHSSNLSALNRSASSVFSGPEENLFRVFRGLQLGECVPACFQLFARQIRASRGGIGEQFPQQSDCPLYPPDCLRRNRSLFRGKAHRSRKSVNGFHQDTLSRCWFGVVVLSLELRTVRHFAEGGRTNVDAPQRFTSRSQSVVKFL